MKRLVTILLLLLFGVAMLARAETEIPHRSSVVDTTNWLSAQESLALTHRIEQVGREQKVIIAVLIIGTLDGEPIEQYAIRVADQWKIGKKGVDNGLLITIARNDRKVRIDVGYGLEGRFPDLIAKRIVDRTLSPKLKVGHPYDALNDAIGMITEVATKEVPKELSSGTGEETSFQDMLDEIPLYGRLNQFGKVVSLIFGVIGGILLLAGFYGDEGGVLLAGVAVPLGVGCLVGLLVNITQFLFVGVVAFIIALIVALGISVGGAAVGGAFGGGGAAGDF